MGDIDEAIRLRRERLWSKTPQLVQRAAMASFASAALGYPQIDEKKRRIVTKGEFSAAEKKKLRDAGFVYERKEKLYVYSLVTEAKQ